MTVTAAQGFKAAAVAAGIKESGGTDLALVVNDGPQAHAAAVFTANRVVAAPVVWTRQAVSDHRLRAVVLNSGGANACTGERGLSDARDTAQEASTALGLEIGDVAVCSTGVIGEYLPMSKLRTGVRAAAASLAADNGHAAAEAIMTTDTVAKTTVVDCGGFTVGGMAKGAGMLAPNLATMLCVLTTDAIVDPQTAQQALRDACARTFDRLDSDGAMSTNDTVILMCSGARNVVADAGAVSEAVQQACADLSAQLLKDAEGSTKDIAIQVSGAATETDAVEVARVVARNNLVKCAAYGNDPNWGRIVAAVGTTSADFEPGDIDVAVNDVWLCRSATAIADASDVDLSGRELRITVDLHAGTETATVWTNDLSVAYVHENSAYTS